MARALGSYPSCPRFESRCRYHFTKDRTTRPFHIERPGGQAVKTPPFHGGNTGSSPVRVTTFSLPFLLYGGIAQPVERPPHTRKVTDSSSVVSTKKRLEILKFQDVSFFVSVPIRGAVLLFVRAIESAALLLGEGPRLLGTLGVRGISRCGASWVGQFYGVI